MDKTAQVSLEARDSFLVSMLKVMVGKDNKRLLLLGLDNASFSELATRAQNVNLVPDKDTPRAPKPKVRSGQNDNSQPVLNALQAGMSLC